jgi:N-acetylmuramoyl-L-alanine amidase
MAIKIFISPSDQFGNKYTGIDTTEGEQMGLLGQLLEARLKKAGFETKLMHRYTMAEKVAVANSWDADLYVCLHSNAGGGNGTHIFYWNKSSKGYSAGLKIFDQLAPITPGTNDRMIQEQTFYEIKYPNAPTVYIETEFHDRKDLALWIVDHLPEMADRICAGICQFYGVPIPGRKFSVCIGTYESEEAASAAAKSVRVIEED